MDNPYFYKEVAGQVIIPTIVLKELDNHKNDKGTNGKNIRIFSKLLKSNTHNFQIEDTSKWEESKKNDNVIIQVCKNLSATLVTSDILMAEIAKGQRVKVIYPKEAKRDFVDTNFTGILNKLTSLYNKDSLLPNEFFKEEGRIQRKYKETLKTIGKDVSVMGITHKNIEQRLSLDLLMDEDIKLVTLKGVAGCGKTLLAIASAMDQLHNNIFNNILIARPTISMGKELGFLPGDLKDKLTPWLMPIYDNLSLMAKPEDLATLEETGLLKIESLSMIRGRSISNQFILIDEAQNLTPHEVKTIITRVGEGSKIVFTGDIDQIDNKECDYINNGLTYLIDAFKDHSIAGHITLDKSERSELASLASEILK